MKKLLIMTPLMLLPFTGCGTGGDGPGYLTVNGLEWQAGPDTDTNWEEAVRWIENLGEGWRMPTVEELKGLYDTGITSSDWWPCPTDERLVWASDQAEEGQAWYLEFHTGESYWYYGDFGSNRRVFAVRDI